MDSNNTKNTIGYYKRWLMENLKTPADIVPLCNQMIEELLNPFWHFSISKKATRWLGVCRPKKRHIEINGNFLNQYFKGHREMVVDTILHEFAHAECYFKFPGRKHGHGDLWLHYCWVLGVSPENRRASVSLDESDYTAEMWQLVNIETGEKYGKYMRRRKDIENCFIKGRPETKGKLAFVPINREATA